MLLSQLKITKRLFYRIYSNTNFILKQTVSPANSGIVSGESCSITLFDSFTSKARSLLFSEVTAFSLFRAVTTTSSTLINFPSGFLSVILLIVPSFATKTQTSITPCWLFSCAEIGYLIF